MYDNNVVIILNEKTNQFNKLNLKTLIVLLSLKCDFIQIVRPLKVTKKQVTIVDM
jgi:hypothetical protein